MAQKMQRKDENFSRKGYSWAPQGIQVPQKPQDYVLRSSNVERNNKS